MSATTLKPVRHILNPPAEKPASGFRYAGNSAAAKLERTMFEKNVTHIGSSNAWEKRVNKNGEERYGGLDLTPEARAYRTVDIKKLSAAELARLHEFEIKHCARFVIGPSEMRSVLKNQSIPDQFPLTAEQMEYVKRLNDDHRPIADRHFMGLPVPPYFAHDYDFDGMVYHHAWDRTVWRIPLEMPKGRGRGKVSDDL